MPGAGPVAPEELLARYVFHRSYVRHDGTIRPEAFVPHPYPDLSVTRHIGLTDDGVWDIGRTIASAMIRTLLGRADLSTDAILGSGLTVLAAPTSTNPHHANITGWPAEKSAQKIRAQRIAVAARYLADPRA